MHELIAVNKSDTKLKHTINRQYSQAGSFLPIGLPVGISVGLKVAVGAYVGVGFPVYRSKVVK